MNTNIKKYAKKSIDVLGLSLRFIIYTVFGGLFAVIRMFGVAEKIYGRGLRYAEKKHLGLRTSFYDMLGSLYERKGDLNKALEMYEKAYQLSSDDDTAHYYYLWIAELYQKQNKLKLAIENYENFLQRDTEFTEESRAKIRSVVDELNEQLESKNIPANTIKR
jgi:tetratricopeptide (TPR) repeat protein